MIGIMGPAGPIEDGLDIAELASTVAAASARLPGQQLSPGAQLLTEFISRAGSEDISVGMLMGLELARLGYKLEETDV